MFRIWATWASILGNKIERSGSDTPQIWAQPISGWFLRKRARRRKAISGASGRAGRGRRRGASAESAREAMAIASPKMAAGPVTDADQLTATDRAGVTRKHECNNWWNTSGSMRRGDELRTRRRTDKEEDGRDGANISGASGRQAKEPWGTWCVESHEAIPVVASAMTTPTHSPAIAAGTATEEVEAATSVIRSSTTRSAK